jgi:hypothetical protein
VPYRVRVWLVMIACVCFCAVGGYPIVRGVSPWPLPVLLVVIAASVVWWVLYGPYEARRLRRERKAKGLCVRCGYDLRRTPRRCRSGGEGA